MVGLEQGRDLNAFQIGDFVKKFMSDREMQKRLRQVISR